MKFWMEFRQVPTRTQKIEKPQDIFQKKINFVVEKRQDIFQNMRSTVVEKAHAKQSEYYRNSNIL